MLADVLQILLISADRMMLSILPAPDTTDHPVSWAAHLHDTDQGWMRAMRGGVQAFTSQAIEHGIVRREVA